MMHVPDALRTTPKGSLIYNRQVDVVKLKHDLNEISPPPLSRYHLEKGSSTLNGSFGLCSNLGDSIKSLDGGGSPMKKSDIDNENCSNTNVKLTDPAEQSPIQNRGSSSYISEKQSVEKSYKDTHQQSPGIEEFFTSSMSPNLAIMEVKEQYHARLERCQLERRKKYDEHNRALSEEMRSKSQETQRRLEHDMEKKESSIERIQQEKKEEASKTLKSLRENNERHKEKMDTKQKEIEQKRLDLEREQQKKQEEFEKKLQMMKSFMAVVEESRTKFNQLYSNFPYKELFPETTDKCKAMLDKLCNALPSKMQKEVQSDHISNEVVASFQSHAEKSQIVVNNLKKQTEEIESQLKAAAEKKKEDEVKQAEDQRKAENAKRQEAAAAQECGVQALSYALKERKSKGELLAQVEASIKGFVTNTDQQMKQYRFDLQRAVNTPINAISGVDSQHLRDKLHRLLALLRCQEVRLGNKVIRADRTPEALLFCQNLVAKMLVRKGEEQVSSLQESAFPIAAVTLGLWCEFPIVGDLFLAHLQALCPYVLPYYHTRQEGETVIDYHRSLGYKVEEDGTIEEQDKFLRRMSGLMRLYCACLITAPPPPTPGGATKPQQGNHFSHPHGLEHAWMWLARSMDQDPHPDVTASLIHDVLVSAGSQLLRRYSVQFVKLVYLLYKQYLPRMKEVAVTSATLGRLEIFLEASLKTARIPEPDGQLSAGFWYS